jgi:hypothetical protein
VAEFYHDVHGGGVIGLNWKLKGEVKFRVGLGASSIPVSKKVKTGGKNGVECVEINLAGMVGEMRKMGDGLVRE